MLNYSPALSVNQTDFIPLYTDTMSGYVLNIMEVSPDGSIVVIGRAVSLVGHADYGSLVFDIDIFSQSNGTLTFLQNVRRVETGGPSGQRAYGGAISSISMSTNGDVIALGQPNYLLNTSYSQRGAVFLLRRNAGTWAVDQIFYNPGSDWNNPAFPSWEGRYGSSVALSRDGNRIIIGDTRVRYISGNQYFIGLCYRFDYNTGTSAWQSKGNIRPGNTTDFGATQYMSEVGYGISLGQDMFGLTSNLSPDNTELFITAPQKTLTDVGGVSRNLSGLGYLYKLVGDVYTFDKIFYDTGPGPGSNTFGYPVSFSNDNNRLLLAGNTASRIYHKVGANYESQARVLTASRNLAPTNISQDGKYAVALSNLTTGCRMRLFDLDNDSYDDVNLQFTSGSYFMSNPRLVNTLVGMCCLALQRSTSNGDSKAVVLFNFG